MIARRSFLAGLAAAIAAPAIVKAASLMPVSSRAIVPVQWMPSPEDLEFLEGMSQRIAQTIIYGDPSVPFSEFIKGYATTYSNCMTA